jgi:hypothetical protein
LTTQRVEQVVSGSHCIKCTDLRFDDSEIHKRWQLCEHAHCKFFVVMRCGVVVWYVVVVREVIAQALADCSQK